MNQLFPDISEPKAIMEGFDEFWSAYPKKVNRLQAVTTWAKLVKKGVLPSVDVLTTSLSRLKQSKDWKKDGGQFIPHPSSWLNAGGWENKVELPKTYDDVKRERVEMAQRNWEASARDMFGHFGVEELMQKLAEGRLRQYEKEVRFVLKEKTNG